ncbi:hypothetical protein FOZ61_002518 [Perkinsus olseni]|uniref:Uncharacterized protein n=1 Tax=Perkinsus olseni TaxID=32597 RepID=A0A7J6LTT0_PEROL|nr:hypothetical protein FOZ61_002518 [Perkinsus olseni]
MASPMRSNSSSWDLSVAARLLVKTQYVVLVRKLKNRSAVLLAISADHAAGNTNRTSTQICAPTVGACSG